MILPGANIGVFFLILSRLDPEIAVPAILLAEVTFNTFKVLNVLNVPFLEGDKTTSVVKLLKAGGGFLAYNSAIQGQLIARLALVVPCIALLYLTPEIPSNMLQGLSAIVVTMVWIEFSKGDKFLTNIVVVLLLGALGTVISRWGGESPMFTLAFITYSLPQYFSREDVKVKINWNDGITEDGFSLDFVTIGVFSTMWWGLPSSLLSGLQEEPPVRQIVKAYACETSASMMSLTMLMNSSGMRSASADTVGKLVDSFTISEGVSWILISVVFSFILLNWKNEILKIYLLLVDMQLIKVLNLASIALVLVVVNNAASVNLLVLLGIGTCLHFLIKELDLKPEITLACISLIPILG